jgi:hypothetical protein
MKRYRQCAFLICILAVSILGCGLLSDIANVVQEAEELLPLTPIGGTQVQVVANVAFDYRETMDGTELVYSSGEWTHTQEGRLRNTIGWLPHLNQIDAGYGGGRIHCYYDWGQADPSTPHWTVQWSSELWFDDGERLASPPIIHLAVYDDNVLVLYAPPIGFLFSHPGSPDDCQNIDPVAAHDAIGQLWFPQDGIDVERAPDADTSTETAIQEGIVVLRIPLERLNAGTTETNTVNLNGRHQSYDGAYEWGLSITLTLSSYQND